MCISFPSLPTALAVAGSALLPGAALFELCIAAASLLAGAEQPALVAVSIPAPLQLPSPGQQAWKATAVCRVDCTTGAVEVASAPGRAVHLLARLSAALANARASVSSAAPAVAAAGASVLVSAPGVAFPPAASSTADIDGAADCAKDVLLSPAVLDCCLHLGALLAAASGMLRVPAGVDALLLPGTAGASPASYAACATERPGHLPSSALLDCSLAAASGQPACSVSGLLARPMARQTQPHRAGVAGGNVLYSVVWEERQQPLQAGELHPLPSELTASIAATHSAALASYGVELLQTLSAGPHASSRSLHLLTAGAQPQLGVAAAAERSSSVTVSLLWGILRSAALEGAVAATGAVDADEHAERYMPGAVLALGAALPAGSDAYGLAQRGERCFQAVLRPAPALQLSSPLGGRASHQQRVAITGGMGTLGSLTAAWCARAQIAAQLVLIGRTGRVAEGSAALAWLASAEGIVELAAADLACREDSARAVGSRTTYALPLTAVFHSGGVLADATVPKQSPAGMRAVLAPKTHAAEVWEPALVRQPAALQLLFSSVASLLGSAGQVNYAGANALLDSMAAAQQQRGVPAASIQWGAWAGGGMAAHDRSTSLRVQRLGMQMVTPESGLRALHTVLASGASLAALVTAVPFDWAKVVARHASGVPPIFSACAALAEPSPTQPAASQTAPHRPALSQIQRSQPTQSQEQLRARLQAEVAAAAASILGGSIGANEPLMAAGLDSLSSVELRNSLEERLGVQLPSTLVFDYPTISSIAGFVASQQAAAPPTAPTAASSAATFERLAAEVADAVSSILGANVSPDAPLMSAGLDSLGAVELRTSLEGCLGVELPPTLVFDYPTVHALTRHLASILQPLADATGAGGYVAGVPEWAGEAHVEGTSSLGAAVAVSALVTRQPAGALQRGSRGAVDALSSMALDRCA